MRLPALCAFLLFLTFATAGMAAIEEYEFADAELEARYHKLIDEMRCPMCLNANLSGSDAPIAADLRAEILKQLEAGRSDREILDFMKARYGDFITYRPPLNAGTALLWFGPLALLLGGFFVLRRIVRTARENPNPDALSLEERQHLDTFLHTDTPGAHSGKDLS